jgi:SlyX protein
MAINEELEERLTNLEMRYAFQEQTIEQLSGEILRQQAQIDDLTKRMKELVGQLDLGVAEKDAEPPPHY